MSLIGMLEQFGLASVLQRVEGHAKSGLLIIKQGMHWVEFYFREGRLMCIGPLRTNATLGDRLLQDGVISPQALQEALFVIGSGLPSETRIALTLMDLGYLGHEELRQWVGQKVIEVLRILLEWTTGEIHFEEEAIPPSDRLLVAMSISSLLTAAINTGVNRGSPPSRQTTGAAYALKPALEQERTQIMPATSATDISKIPTLLNAEDFLLDTAADKSLPLAGGSPNVGDSSMRSNSSSLFADSGVQSNSSPLSTGQLVQPVSVITPATPRRIIDTSLLRPDMVLMPADLSALREQNVQVQLTPDQWRLLTRVDGRTTLQMACQELAMLPELVCQVAAELMAENLIHVVVPGQGPIGELSPVSRELMTSGLSNGYVAPGYAATAASPWSAPLSAPPPGGPQFFSSLSFETESQWGNGGNGATFVPGRGWIASPQPLQPLQPSGPLASSGVYAPIGGPGY